MNSVVLIGRLARDVELSYTPSTQTAVARFTLAVDRPRKQGEENSEADFIRITVFGKLGEACDRYLSKGRQAAVQGRIQTGSYKNKEGVTIYTTDVIAERVEFLGGSQGGANRRDARASSSVGSSNENSSDQLELNGLDDLPDSFQAAEDDIPF